jgi:hypothetical protein
VTLLFYWTKFSKSAVLLTLKFQNLIGVFIFLTFTAKIFQNLIDPWNLTGLKVEANPSLSISISLFGILKHHNLIFIAKVFKTMLLPFSYVLFISVRTVGLMFNRGICFLI